MALAAKQKSFFLWCLHLNPKMLAQAMHFFPVDLQKQFEDLSQKTKNLDEAELKKFALRELKKFQRSFHTSYLPEVHNDWLVEKLKKESPFMVSAILRYLPADRVRQILNQLPSNLLTQLPKLSESYAISKGLSESLKRRFESQFELEKINDRNAPFDFQSLYFLKANTLRTIFKELGYREIALGLKNLPEKTKQLVLGRLLPTDRFEVEKFFEKESRVSDGRYKRAQVHIISQEISDVEFFVREIGFLVYSKAVLLADQKDLKVIYYKMSQKEAKLLKKHIQQNLKQNSEATVLAYREEILQVCKKVLKG